MKHPGGARILGIYAGQDATVRTITVGGGEGGGAGAGGGVAGEAPERSSDTHF